MSESVMLNKIITCEVKEVAPRVLEFIASTEDKDRQGDIIRASGWKLDNYLKNPVFQWAHDYSQPPIGKAVKVWVQGKKLMTQVEFADRDTYEFADTIYRLYKGGFLKAVSVGLTPKNWEGKSGDDDSPKWSGNVFIEQELLEVSGCPVPANPEALATAKAKRIISAKEYKAFNEFLKQETEREQEQEMAHQKEVITKPEETDNYIRIPVPKEEGKHDGHRIRTITISDKEGIKALYCGEDKVVITYLFDKDKDWTMESAQAWCDEHAKDQKVLESRAVSQAEIADEIDYLFAMIDECGLSPENAESLKVELEKQNLTVKVIERITGGDMPDKDIKPITGPPPAETLTDKDRTLVAQIISRTIDRVIENRRK